METSSSLICRQWDNRLLQHIAGIQSHIHHHSGNAAFFLAIDHHPLDRSRTAVLRKQRRVHIHTPVARHIQNRSRYNLPKSLHNYDIRMICPQTLDTLAVSDFLRLIYFNAVLERTCLDRCIAERLASSHCLIRLGDNQRHLMSRFYDFFQRSHREIRCSHEYDSHH